MGEDWSLIEVMSWPKQEDPTPIQIWDGLSSRRLRRIGLWLMLNPNRVLLFNEPGPDPDPDPEPESGGIEPGRSRYHHWWQCVHLSPLVDKREMPVHDPAYGTAETRKPDRRAQIKGPRWRSGLARELSRGKRYVWKQKTGSRSRYLLFNL